MRHHYAVSVTVIPSKRSVPVGIELARPQPATIGLFDMAPESFFNRHLANHGEAPSPNLLARGRAPCDAPPTQRVSPRPPLSTVAVTMSKDPSELCLNRSAARRALPENV